MTKENTLHTPLKMSVKTDEFERQFRRDCAGTYFSVTVARDGGAKSPCKWCSESVIWKHPLVVHVRTSS